MDHSKPGGESWITENGDPRDVYRDALIVLDPAKHLNNGQPSLWASHLAILDVRPGITFSILAAALAITRRSWPSWLAHKA